MGIKIQALEDWLDKLKAIDPRLKELAKQCIDQPLHVLMAVASVWVIGGLLVLAHVPVWLAAAVAGVITAAWMAYREYKQWPSERWYDPILDWTFEAGGLALGLWWLISALG